MDLHDKRLLYNNPLSTVNDLNGFRLEGNADLSFENNRLQIQNVTDEHFSITPGPKPSDQLYNIVYWCPEHFPSNIAITWDFWPLNEPGLCIMFFAAKGINDKDVHADSLAKRHGDYGQYHHGDINAYHLAYFRRRYKSEQALQLVNLRKSYGFHLVAQGADPIPSIAYTDAPYHMKIIKFNGNIQVYINELKILEWTDNDVQMGPPLSGGKIAFRQMAPMVAEYANLKVYEL